MGNRVRATDTALLTAMDDDQVVKALAPLRQLLRSDGGDMSLLDVDRAQGAVRLRLELEDASCADCVMPRAYLEQVALNVLRRSLPELLAVTVDDPREQHPSPQAGGEGDG